MIVANLKSKVGAKEQGYPWSSDRERLVAGSQEAIDSYIVNEMFQSVVSRQANILDQAIERSTKLPGGKGYFINVGQVEGHNLNLLQGLGTRPYMEILNKYMTRLHDRFEGILAGKTWNSVYGKGTFGKSAFGGFGVSSEWLGLNVYLDWGGRSPIVRGRYKDAQNLLLYDPWGLLENANRKAAEMGVPMHDEPKGPKRQPMKVPRIPKSALQWDPHAVITVPTVGEYSGGKVNPDAIHWQRDDARDRANDERYGPEDHKYYRDKVAAFEQALDGYKKKLQQHLAARVVHLGQKQEMVDPTILSVTSLKPDGPQFRSIYDDSIHALLDRVVDDQLRLEEFQQEPDPNPNQLARYRQNVLDAQATYDYNAEVEDMILSYSLQQNGAALMEVDSGGDYYPLDQDGLDQMASTRDSLLNRYGELDPDEPDTEYYKRLYLKRVTMYDAALERAEKITGLTANAQATRGQMSDMMAQDRPLSRDYKDMLRGWFLSTVQHEFIHNAVREHGKEEFSNFLTFLVGSTNDAETMGIVGEMIDQLEKSGGLQQMAADMSTYYGIRSAENVFAKVGVRAGASDIERGPDRGDVRGGGQGTGRGGTGRLPGDGREYRVQPQEDLLAGVERQPNAPEELRDAPRWGLDEQAGPSASASNPVPPEEDPRPLVSYSTPEGQIPMFGDDEVAMAPAPEDDPYQDVDPEYLQALDDYEASREIAFPDDPPMTDTPADLAQAIAAVTEPTEPPQGDDVVNLGKFPDWAQRLVSLGELTSTRTDVNTRSPLVEGQPDVVETPAVDMSDAQVRDVQNLITKGPNAKDLTSAEIDALRGAILLQYDRYIRASTALQSRKGGDVEMASLRTLDEAMRYAAITGLATTPMDSWDVLGNTLARAPLSQGAGETLDQFLAANKDLIGNPNDLQRNRLRQLAMERADQLVGPDSGPTSIVGIRGRSARVVNGARALAQTATTPGIPPSVQASVIRSNEDLGIGITEAIMAARYNGLLLGPRGILIDYISNTGQALTKVMTDPFLPSQGGANLRARAAITRAEMAAIRQFWPIMLHRVSNTLLYGVSEQQASASGTPHSMSGRLSVRLEDAQADYTAAKIQAESARNRGDTAEAARQERRASEANKEIWALRGKKVAAIGFVEIAGRLKAVADVSIGTLVYGMELARNSAIMAYNEGTHPVGSEAWYRRVAEIMDGQKLHADPKQNAVMYRELQRSATREAQRMTYQGKMGTIGQQLERIQRNPLGSFVLPFLRALYHIRGMAIDYSPLGAVGTAYDVARSYIPTDNRFMRATRNMGGIAGGPYARAFRGNEVGPAVADLDRRMAANAIGTAAFFWILGQAFAGNISGAGPPDQPIPLLEDDDPDFDAIKLQKTMESTGWRRYSVRIPWGGKNHWVSYANWGPLAYLLSSAAAIAEAYKYGMPPDVERPESDDFFSSRKLYQMVTQGDAGTVQTAGRRFAGVAKEMSYLSGFFDLLGFAENAGSLVFGAVNPDPKLTTSQQVYEQRRHQAEASRYLGNLVTQFMPLTSLVNTIAQSQDTVIRAPEFGDLKSQLASRTPELGPFPYIGPPVGMPDLYADRHIPVVGSQTGRREGLAQAVDRLGHPIVNEYQGLSAFLPFHVVDENLSSPVLNAAVDVGLGIPGAPQEIRYKPEGMKTQMLLLTPRMREALGQKIGQKIDTDSTKLLQSWPEEKRRADPSGFKDALGAQILASRKAVIDEYGNDEGAGKATFEALAQDPNRRRDYDPAPKDKPPDIGPPVGPGTPSPTPRAGSTPQRGTPAPTAAPAPTATPNPATESPAERNRRLIRERMQTPVPAGR